MMKPLRFYEHFACAYGTIWLIFLSCAFLIQEHIDAGAFGLFGFPVIALIYALIRKSGDADRQREIDEIRSELVDLRRQQDQEPE